MRVSNVNKALAASEAKKALENSYGVIESSAENIQISGKGYQNPLAGVAGWGETYMGATMASVLNGYEDPRISIYYSPATLADHTEEYLGVPQGVYAKMVIPITIKVILLSILKQSPHPHPPFF